MFGKGYQSLTPILGHTRAEYEKMLGSVEKGQVITEAEAKKAEKFRLAEDQLGDALKDVTIAVGEQVAGLAPLLVGLAKLVGLLSGGAGDFLTFGSSADGAYETLYQLHGEIEAGGGKLEHWQGLVREGKISLDEAVKSIHEAAAAHRDVKDALDGGEKSWEQAVASSDDLTGSFEHLGVASQDAKGDVQAYTDQVDKTSREVQSDIDAMQHAWDTLFDNLNAEQSMIRLKQQAEDVKKANEDAGKAIKEHGPGSPEAIAAVTEARDKQIELEKATALYAKDIAGLPPEVVTRIAAEIGAGDIDKAIAEVDSAFFNHAFRINAHVDNIIIDGETHAAGSGGPVHLVTPAGNQGAKGGALPQFASGGTVPGPTGAPTLAVVHGGETVIPNGGSTNGAGGMTNNFYGITDPTDIARKIAREVGWALRAS